MVWPVVQDYAVPGKLLCQTGVPPSAADDDDVIPGLAGITAAPAISRKQPGAAALPEKADGRTTAYTAAAGAERQGPAETSMCGSSHGSTKQFKPPGASSSSFMKWLSTEVAATQQKTNTNSQQHAQQQQELSSLEGCGVDGDEDATLPFSPGLNSSKSTAAAAAAAGKTNAAFHKTGSTAVQRVFVGAQGDDSRAAAAAAAAPSDGAGRTPGRSASSVRGKFSGKAKACMPAGALERFLKPSGSPGRQRQEQLPKPSLLKPLLGEQQQQMLEMEGGLASPSIIDCCSSPEVAPLAARLAASHRRAAAAAASCGPGAANHPAAADAPAVEEPPSKKQCSPQKAGDEYLPSAARVIGTPADTRQQPLQGRVQQRLFQPAVHQQQMAGPLALHQQVAAHPAGKSMCSSSAAATAGPHRTPAGMSAAYLALLQEVGALSPPQQLQREQQQPETLIVDLLHSPDINSTLHHRFQLQQQRQQQQQQQSAQNEVIDLT
jgi:hypothetical protein